MRTPEVTLLPKAVAAWRNARGLTQKVLAEKVVASGTRCSLAAIGMIESEERQATLELATAIALALDVDLDVIAVPHGSKLAQRIITSVASEAVSK